MLFVILFPVFGRPIMFGLPVTYQSKVSACTAAHYRLTAQMRELELQFEQMASELRATFVQEVEAITAEAAE
jgi:hypothetical protein